MKYATPALLGATAATAATLSPNIALSAVRRASNDSPTGGYAPGSVSCPATLPTIRSATGISDSESTWLKTRTPKTQAAFASYLSRVSISGFDASAYLANDNAQPRLAAAISGGGYRALMYGAGFLKAADNRTEGTTDAGGIGGLLQSLTYLAGLSGGSWLVGSMYMNNFSSIADIQDNAKLWQFQDNILEGPEAESSTVTYLAAIQQEVATKQAAGFDVSLTDYWGRALAYQLIADTDGGAGYTMSSIADSSDFANGDLPLPLIVAVGRAPDTTVISLNSTVFEFTPLEFGSWDASPSAFAPIEYLGSNFSAGSLTSNTSCVRGFDAASFVMGTSSSLFNVLLANNAISTLNLTTFQTTVLNGILQTINSTDNDIAPFRPNPFLSFQPSTNKLSTEKEVALVDGGEDGQNVPLWPLLQSARDVDVIYAVDSSADTSSSWPNGTALRATYARTQQSIGQGTPFPVIPSAETFINLQLNQKPTFFGCNAFASTGSADAIPPLVVYMPNAPYSYYSNVSTLTMSYELGPRDSIILNGYNSASQGNSSSRLDSSDWSVCVACAALARSFERTNTTAPAACTACYEKHCWNGTTDETAVSYEPSLLLDEVSVGTSLDQESGAVVIAGRPAVRGVALGVAVAIAAVLF